MYYCFKNIYGEIKGMRINIFLMILLAAVLTGCSTLDKNYISDENNKIEADDLKLEIGYDVYHFKVDLIRNTRTETRTTTDAQGISRTETTQIDVPYHYLGVRFGNGLFYDYNKNLCVDLIKFYGMDEENFLIKLKGKGLFSPSVEYKKINNNFEREVKALFGNKTKAEFKDNEIYIEEGLFQTDAEINISENEIEFNPKGVFGFLSKARIKSTPPSAVEFPGFWKDEIFTQDSSDKITLSDSFSIRKDKNEIVFEYKGLFNSRKSYHFMKTENGFIFYDEKYHGVKVEKHNNTITVYSDNKKMYDAVIY